MKSSFCNFGDCVEVEFANGRVYVCGEDQTVSFTNKEWTQFLAGVRNGEFDVPPTGDAHELEQASPPK